MWKCVSMRPPVISISSAETIISQAATTWRVRVLPPRVSIRMRGSAARPPPIKIAAQTWMFTELSPPDQVRGETERRDNSADPLHHHEPGEQAVSLPEAVHAQFIEQGGSPLCAVPRAIQF